MLEYINNLFEHISPAFAYLVLFASAYTENVLPPVPGDTVVVLGAYMVSTGQLNFYNVYFSTCFGGIFGFMTMYFIGAKFGRPFFYKKSRSKIFQINNISKVEKWFSKWGYWVIFANRFLSGTRSVISIFAGIFHLKAWVVLLLATVSMLIWNGLLIYLGILLGENWEIITDIISKYNRVIIFLTILIAVYFIFRRKKKKEDKGE